MCRDALSEEAANAILNSIVAAAAPPASSKIALANYSGSGRDLTRLILAARLRNTALRTTALSHICGTECFAIFVMAGVMGPRRRLNGLLSFGGQTA